MAAQITEQEETPLASGRLRRFVASTPAFPARSVDVWIPNGNEPSAGRPLLIVQDGQNLFVDGLGTGEVSWRLADTVSRLASLGQIDPPIIAGIWNTGHRWSEYCPPLVTKMLDPSGAVIDGQPIGNKYAAFVLNEIVPTVTHDLGVDSSRQFAMGSSMGGLISLYLLCEYPDQLAGAASLSTHWPIIGQEIVPYLKERLPSPGRHRIYLDRGTVGLDASYQRMQEMVDQTIGARGWRRDIDWISHTSAGASHDEKSWASGVEKPLAFLLSKSVLPMGQ